MKLIKYCTKENIKKNNSIRIGTLNYHQDRSDKNEGIFENINVEGTGKQLIISSNFINSFSDSTFVPATPDIPAITMNNSELCISGKKEFPNYYMFSCSLDTEEQELSKVRFGCNSSYEITDIQEFALTVSNFLVNRLEMNVDLQNAKLLLVYDSIKYTNSIDGIKITTNPTLNDVIFSKYEKFQWENEYRFIWMLFDSEGKLLNVPDEFVDIPITKLKNCLNFNF